MPYSRPTADDLAALSNTADYLHETIGHLTEDAARLELVRDRLLVPDDCPPPPPCPEAPALLPQVGICGASSFNGLTRSARQSALALIRAAGITHFRFDASWVSIERTAGVYTLGPKIEMVKDIVAAGLIPLAVVAYTPTFYRQVRTDQFSAPTPNAVATAWPKFLRTLFQALVSVGCFRFEVWNEPNHAGPPGMNPVLPTLYADLCAHANIEASIVSRHIVLQAGAISPAPDKLPTALGGTAFLKAILAYDPRFPERINEWSIHPYAGKVSFDNGSMWKTHYPPMRAALPAHVPMSATECGWSSHPTLGVGEAKQAEYLVDAIEGWAEGAPFYIFNWQDWGAADSRDNSQGLVRLDGTLKPSYAAVKELLVG